MQIQENELVLVFYNKEKSWLIKVSKGKSLHTHLGFFKHDDIIGKEYGSSIETNLGKKLFLLKPNTNDLALRVKRKTQVVYTKDSGYIIARTGLCSGMKVVEAGTGSGVLTIMLANIVKPLGHVYSYEIREDFYKLAGENINKAGLRDYVTLINKDVKEGFDFKDADLAVIDLADPWNVVRVSWEALKPSALFVAICPTVNQVEKLVSELSKGFVDIESVEILLREWEMRKDMSRPKVRMVAHTAYITFARKILI
ncbi:MAG: tRNA (adenine-N1)-methyltransferase [Nitrososphaerales archaeon]